MASSGESPPARLLYLDPLLSPLPPLVEGPICYGALWKIHRLLSLCRRKLGCASFAGAQTTETAPEEDVFPAPTFPFQFVACGEYLVG